VIHHPALLDEVAEHLGNLHFADSGLDKLRQEALKHLTGWVRLDSEGAQHYLRSCGYAQILDGLLDATSQLPAAFVRPDAPMEETRTGWEHTYKLYMLKELSADQRLAEQELATDLTLDRVERLTALVRAKDEGTEG